VEDQNALDGLVDAPDGRKGAKVVDLEAAHLEGDESGVEFEVEVDHGADSAVVVKAKIVEPDVDACDDLVGGGLDAVVDDVGSVTGHEVEGELDEWVVEVGVGFEGAGWEAFGGCSVIGVGCGAYIIAGNRLNDYRTGDGVGLVGGVGEEGVLGEKGVFGFGGRRGVGDDGTEAHVVLPGLVGEGDQGADSNVG
jgi:hypothetical protein